MAANSYGVLGLFFSNSAAFLASASANFFLASAAFF